ncbi:MAG: FixH family protein [Hyphomicrobiaceae bacterium]|jgi:nitrogen fixation protein FixH
MSASVNSPARELRGHHVLFIFLSFFGVIFAVNGYFLYSALGTHTGVVSVEPYRKGLHYNDRIALEEKQVDLGWSHGIEASLDGRVVVLFNERGGAPVAGLKVVGNVGRPSTSEFDRKLAFNETAPGRYEAVTEKLEAGAWIASLEAFPPASTTPAYRGRNRLWLKL